MLFLKKPSHKESFTGLLFLLPYTCFFIAFWAGPVLAAFVIAFFEWELLRGTFEFNGLENFEILIEEDDLFWLSMKNAIYFSVLTTIGIVILSLSTAIALKRIFKFQVFFRVMLYAPVVLSITVIAIIFLQILNLNGLLNYALSFFGMSQVNFLGDASLVIPSVALTTIWWSFGFPMLVFLAALYAISATLYEASKIDGATNIQQFIFVTRPLIRPATLFVIVTQFITHMQVFGQPLLMTRTHAGGPGGGPGHASYTILLHIYQNAWRYYHVGYAAAMSLVLSIFMLMVVAILFKLLGQKVEY